MDLDGDGDDDGDGSGGGGDQKSSGGEPVVISAQNMSSDSRPKLVQALRKAAKAAGVHHSDLPKDNASREKVQALARTVHESNAGTAQKPRWPQLSKLTKTVGRSRRASAKKTMTASWSEVFVCAARVSC